MKLSNTDRYRLRELRITPSVIPPKGTVIWWKGRKRLYIGEFAKIAIVPAGADGVMVSTEDFLELDAALNPPRAPPDILAAG